MKIRAVSPIVFAHTMKCRWYEGRLGWRIHESYMQLRVYMRHMLFAPGNIIHMRSLRRKYWYDSDVKLFEVTFQILVDYVEQELAWEQFLDGGKVKWYSRHASIKNKRELGLRRLDWEIQLGSDSPNQSDTAREVKELYLWYKDVRPNRVDPWNTMFDTNGDVVSDLSGNVDLPPLPDGWKEAAHRAQEVDVANEEEDTKQAIRVMNIRRSMWT